MIKTRLLLWSAFVGLAAASCDSKFDFGDRFASNDPSSCPVFEIQKMKESGITLPAAIEGFIIAAPSATTECKGVVGYRSLYVYSPLVPTGDLQIIQTQTGPNGSSPRETYFKARVALTTLPWNQEIQFKIRDRLKASQDLFKTNGSLQPPKPLGDLELDFVFGGTEPFSVVHYPDQDKKYLEFIHGTDQAQAEIFAQRFNDGRESIELIHNEASKPHSGTGLSDRPAFFASTLSHPNQQRPSALQVVEPTELLRRVWLRAETEEQKRFVIGAAVQWLARTSIETIATHPTSKEVLDFCKTNWNPFPTVLDSWALTSMKWISLLEPTSNARVVSDLLSKLIGNGESPEFALDAAVEIVKNSTYNSREIDRLLELSRKIRQNIKDVKNPWTSARLLFDRLGRDQAKSEQALALAIWLNDERLFLPTTEVTCFNEAVDTVSLGLGVDQLRTIYREVIQWVNLTSRQPLVWNYTKEWAARYNPSLGQLLVLRQFYSWLISADGMAWDAEKALIVAQGYVLGSFQATPAQLNLFRDAIRWLRSPDGPHITSPDILMSKAQIYIFEKKLNPGLLQKLISRFGALLSTGLEPLAALTQAESEILG